MIAIEAKVGLLRRPATYPDAPGRVDVVETHMSWVFLTDRYAYKMKKPVRYDFLDFSTLALRQRDCEAEVRLNRRFARMSTWVRSRSRWMGTGTCTWRRRRDYRVAGENAPAAGGTNAG